MAILALAPAWSAAAWATAVPGVATAEVPILSAADLKAGRAAMAAAKGGKYTHALDLASKAQNPLLAKIVRWLELTEPGRRGNFAAASAFIAENLDWPGQIALQQRAEASLPSELPHEAVLEWFKARPPITVAGTFRYAAALIATGHTDAATALLRDTWVQQDFPKGDEVLFRRRFGKVLSPEDDLARLDRLLWDRQASAARRQAKRLGDGYVALAEARLALAAMSGGVDSAVQRVPKELANDPGLIFERARWRQRKDRYQGVLELLDPPNPDAPRPDLWWNVRHWTVRQALVKGDISAAYRIAAKHGLSTGVAFAEGEWLAGWISLRFLDQPEQAYAHFTRLHDGVNTPISRARAAFWAGEAAVALAARDQAESWQTTAKTWYAAAARLNTTFYGQLASRQLGMAATVSLGRTQAPDDAARAAFTQRDLVQAIRVLGELGDSNVQEKFLNRLSTISLSESDYILTAELAQQQRRPDLAVKAAKAAAADGILLVDHLYPFPTLPQGESPEPALVMAVVRQESAFYTDAVSGAGAHGLMQILPKTAKGLARDMNMRFSKSKLLTDPEYNMRLGRAYLSELTRRYGGSYILALAAYNAGPSRANSWIRAFGDPRDPDVDAIDWIESIPFDETRNYVQRILEGLVVYRQQLGADGTSALVDPFANRPTPAASWAARDDDFDPNCCL
jgi:soluble lytic murein transglycosylase